MAFPVFEEIEGAVSHGFQDWSGYADIAAIESTTAADGSQWSLGDPTKNAFVADPDPFNGDTRCLEMDFTAPADIGSTYSAGVTLDETGMLDAPHTNRSIVIQWAAKFSDESGSLYYFQGKTCDYSAETVARHDFDPRQDKPGLQTSASCAADSICSRHYPSGEPVDAGHPDEPTEWVWCDATTPGADLPGSDDTWFAKQTHNYGTGQGKTHWGSELIEHPTQGPANIGGTEPRDAADWWEFTLRYTKSADGTEGEDRIEYWLDKGDGFGPFKVLEMLGDQGQFDAGEVWCFGSAVFPVGEATFVNWYQLTATLHPGSCIMRLGYIHVWSHPWLALS